MTMVTKRVIRLIADMAEEEHESLTLAVLRDTLLPNLIFGQIRVADAERTADSCETNAEVSQ